MEYLTVQYSSQELLGVGGFLSYILSQGFKGFKSLSLITRGYTRKHKIHRQQIQTIQNLNHNGNILLLMIVDTLV